MPQPPWWKGSRGEWYVIAQFVLFALVVFGPRTWSGSPTWTSPYMQLGTIGGGILLLMGGLLAVAGIFGLGANLTPLPYPKDEATLVETGPYRLVRHPIYSGVILMPLVGLCGFTAGSRSVTRSFCSSSLTSSRVVKNNG